MFLRDFSFLQETIDDSVKDMFKLRLLLNDVQCFIRILLRLGVAGL